MAHDCPCDRFIRKDDGPPATGEWTPDYVRQLMRDWSSENDGYRIVSSKHNAALAVEREKSYNKGRADAGRAYELAMRDNRELDKQLTAKGEKFNVQEQQWLGENLKLTDEVQQLKAQLAAAEQKVRVLTDQMQKDFQRDLS